MPDNPSNEIRSKFENLDLETSGSKRGRTDVESETDSAKLRKTNRSQKLRVRYTDSDNEPPRDDLSVTVCEDQMSVATLGYESGFDADVDTD